MYAHKVTNPFTGESTVRQIDISHLLFQEDFICLKEHISKHLLQAIADMENSEIPDHSKITRMQQLVVQLYQPINLEQLIQKLLRFNEHLFDVPQFVSVLNHLKGRKS